MKKYLLPQILFLLIISAAFALNAYPQTAETPAATPPAAEAMGENDSLPFMQNQPAAEDNQPGTGNLLIKTVGAMLLIVGLMFFGAWGLKKAGFDRFKQNDAAGAIDLAVVSTVSMGGGRTISAVRFGERILLVGSTAQTFTLLADEPAQNAPPSPASRSVADLLGEQNKSFGNEFQQAQNRLGDWENQGERFK
ncbi:MAG: flagellar biosynthetic protein FliO [Pyrinomonadaceae bacterium]|nr:flagellar biosynthetic protein FliO [Pyrinomonadaceae bacterium]